MSSIKLNKLTPAVQYPASTTVKGCQAGGLGHLLKYMRIARVQCREYKTGQQKVQLSRKRKHFAHLGILFIYGKNY